MEIGYPTDAMEARRELLDIETGLIASDIFTTYVVYMEPGGWSLSGGIAAEVLLASRCILTYRNGNRAEERRHGDPPAKVRERLADLPIVDWSAYGWTALELAPAIAGLAVDDDRVLLQLVVPETEVRLAGGKAVSGGLHSEALAAVEEAIAGIGPQSADGLRTSVRMDPGADADAYRKGVSSLVEDARGGLLQKAVVSRVVPVEEVDFPASYAGGRRANAPARSFVLDLGVLPAFGFSPETGLEADADGRVASRPVAGTRALTGDAELDRKLREDLLANPEELHEHAISVEVAVDELAGPGKPETVAVAEYTVVKERGTVQHLASKVVGRMPEGAGPWDAFAAVSPAVTVPAVPKRAAYEAICRYEGQARGPYAGTVVKVTQDGTRDPALVLRSVYSENGRTWLRAAAGVVEQSSAERELEETREKLTAVSQSLLAGADSAVELVGDIGAAADHDRPLC